MSLSNKRLFLFRRFVTAIELRIPSYSSFPFFKTDPDNRFNYFSPFLLEKRRAWKISLDIYTERLTRISIQSIANTHSLPFRRYFSIELTQRIARLCPQLCQLINLPSGNLKRDSQNVILSLRWKYFVSHPENWGGLNWLLALTNFQEFMF